MKTNDIDALNVPDGRNLFIIKQKLKHHLVRNIY